MAMTTLFFTAMHPLILSVDGTDQHGGGLLSDADLNISLALPKELGADGVVIWVLTFFLLSSDSP